MSRIVRVFLPLYRRKKSDSQVIEEINAAKEKGMQPYSLSRMLKFNCDVKRFSFDEMQVYQFQKNVASTIVLYLSGGAYVRRPTFFHLRAIKKLVYHTNASFIMPIYPLIPFANCEQNYELLSKFYKKIIADYPNKQIILMGDSAGGGLALGLCNFWEESGIKLPDKLILLSPWVDVSMENQEISKYATNDPVICLSSCKIWGKLWADDLDLKDYRVSPIYADFKKLTDVTIFVGTQELLYPDITMLYDKLVKKGIKAKLYIGNKMNHDFPLYPIPEAKKALKECIEIINTIND